MDHEVIALACAELWLGGEADFSFGARLDAGLAKYTAAEIEAKGLEANGTGRARLLALRALGAAGARAEDGQATVPARDRRAQIGDVLCALRRPDSQRFEGTYRSFPQ